ncbi:N-acyl-D-glucosamine 2-epimerase [Rubidibacter lacunae KORDI 51-2]|uniref:N-acyl-D-glucosamine 2-epimerase n=1 Tax=Rubidibacter lacunae KORDI 51-2 TaxID=582515 RepID=U5DQV3_9CHRO|nr:AGE family epimerase/isomerase [Rubidibacter lacunae]ERN42055.1 N-acyl-D-glucosamine 2-epimerase [Rubidibacter lacunae KORDI 51-2]
MTPSPVAIAAYRRKYERELFERVIPFWLQYSLDRERGGYFNCLDRDGSLYDTTKHVWLQGRQAWLFAKLYRTVESKPEWLAAARLGVDFLQHFAIRPDRRAYFSLTEDGKPIQLQRKIFSECFYTMALAEFSRASDRPDLLAAARDELATLWDWAYDWSYVGRPVLAGQHPAQSLAVPMILLNLIEEIAPDDASEYAVEVEDCIRRILLHVNSDEQLVYETVAPDGSQIASPQGRLLNPGHAIEAGWFLQHWAQRLQREDLSADAIAIVRWSFARGWDDEYGGIFYFLDAEGYSPTPLEWSMKLWWVQCEALYAHLLNFSLTGDRDDWDAFERVDAYCFEHFSDPKFGEWFGYCDRQGNVTHRFKGGPYKGCFHVPRALLLCWRLLQALETPNTQSVA